MGDRSAGNAALIEGAWPSGVIHRDLKPTNIMLRLSSDGHVAVKVIDFGLAKFMGESTRLSSVFKGTHLYMAPEQFRNEPITFATDVHGLGLVLLDLARGTLRDGDIILKPPANDIALLKAQKRFSSRVIEMLERYLSEEPSQRMKSPELQAFAVAKTEVKEAIVYGLEPGENFHLTVLGALGGGVNHFLFPIWTPIAAGFTLDRLIATILGYRAKKEKLSKEQAAYEDHFFRSLRWIGWPAGLAVFINQNFRAEYPLLANIAWVLSSSAMLAGFVTLLFTSSRSLLREKEEQKLFDQLRREVPNEKEARFLSEEGLALLKGWRSQQGRLWQALGFATLAFSTRFRSDWTLLAVIMLAHNFLMALEAHFAKRKWPDLQSLLNWRGAEFAMTGAGGIGGLILGGAALYQQSHLAGGVLVSASLISLGRLVFGMKKYFKAKEENSITLDSKLSNLFSALLSDNIDRLYAVAEPSINKFLQWLRRKPKK